MNPSYPGSVALFLMDNNMFATIKLFQTSSPWVVVSHREQRYALGFQVIINDAASEAKSSVWKYVDDLTFGENHLFSDDGFLQSDMDDFVKWSQDNKLSLNATRQQTQSL